MTSPGPRETFRIEANAFDTGLLAGNVGILRFSEPPAAAFGLAARVRADAAQQGYDLVMLRTDAPVEIDGFAHVGTTEEYSGTVISMLARLTPSRHFEIVRVTGDEWNEIEQLLEHAAPTRFGRDPQLAPETVRRHKLANLKARASASPQYTRVARSPARGALGFQCSYVAGDTYQLYELVTAPTALRGVIAAELIAANLGALRLDHPHVQRVAAIVYEDNAASIAFFSRLGLRHTAVRHYHYHLWL